MKKYMVETLYTCTFKTVHSLNNLNDSELSKIDKRTDGEVEVTDAKLNNRKTKKICVKKDDKSNDSNVDKKLSNKISKQMKSLKDDP